MGRSIDDVIEEDWSHLLPSSCSSTAPLRFQHHDEILIPLPFPCDENEDESADNCTPFLRIQSVQHLSPLDMMNLSYGTEDATGHRIWLGARFFVQAIPFLWHGVCRSPKRLLELGCGTGLSGVACGKYFDECHASISDASPMLTQLTLTDNAEDCLQLALTNVQTNLSSSLQNIVMVEHLEWTNHIDNQSAAIGEKSDRNLLSSSSSLFAKYDTVIATDVIYDIGAVAPLLRTAFKYLADGGVFILSHIPRAALPENCDFATDMAEYIIHEATRSSMPFSVHSILHPHDLLHIPHNNMNTVEESTASSKTTVEYSQSSPAIEHHTQQGVLIDRHLLDELHDVGASILIFEKMAA